MAASVFVTRPLPDPGVDAFEAAGFEVRHNAEDRPLTRAELLEGVVGADALVSMLSDRIDAELLDVAPTLKVVANYAVGFDNVDVAEARRRGVEVTTTPDVLSEATADLAWALLLAAARRLGEGERFVRSGGWSGPGPLQLLGQAVGGRTLGIVGMGAIGQAVARRARGFSMPVLYFNRNRVPAAVEQDLGARYVALDELLATSDIVSLHAPLNDDSRHLIDAAALARMKPSAVLVNTARGALVDEAALVEALREGRIAAAGLDVYEREPQLAEGLAELENVVLSPHVGSATTETRGTMVQLCLDNVVAVLSGRPAVTPAPTPSGPDRGAGATPGGPAPSAPR
jgi:glyoxylate reductase